MSHSRFKKVWAVQLMVVDYIVAAGSILLAWWIRARWEGWLPFESYAATAFSLAAVWVLIFLFEGLYTHKPWGRYGREAVGIGHAVSIGTTAFILLSFLITDFPFSRAIVLLSWGLGIGLIALARWLMRGVRASTYASGAGLKRVFVIGSGSTADEIRDLMSTGKIEGAQLAGSLETPGAGDNGFSALKEADEIYLAGEIDPKEAERLQAWCLSHEIGLKLHPQAHGLMIRGVSFEEIPGLPIATVKSPFDELWVRMLKRAFDVIVALAALICLSPLFLIVAIMIKLKMPGPVFFSHKRLGKRGGMFRMLKFRSMVVNAEEVLKKDPKLWEEFQKGYKLKDDPRILPLGHFLRKTSIDELPQLINVLKGEMSIVGPRPIVESELEKYGPWGEVFLSVPPGLTGLWQVSGRTDISYDERVRLDVHYIENWSLMGDISIIIQTPAAVLSRKGSY